MQRRLFLFATAIIVLAGSWILHQQRKLILETRQEQEAETRVSESSRESRPETSRLQRDTERPSPELLKLRNEVTMLRRDLDSPSSEKLPRAQWEQDWALVHSGPKPSEQPGFIDFSNLTNAGFSTPEATFHSFSYAMRRPDKEPITDTRMKELWDVPDDYDDPNAGYSIHLGEGIGGEIGYRIVRQEMLSTNQVRLTIDYERPDGSSFRRQKVLVENKGRWRMKPAGLTRAPMPTAP